MNDRARRGTRAAIIALCVLLAAPPGDALEGEPPEWVVDADDPGPNLPAEGRSLFDHVFRAEVNGRPVYDVPYPFREFVARLAGQADGDVRAVLIPFGRSLQRSAASDDYFGAPRVVLAVTGTGREAPGAGHRPFRDRLFAGYQERAGIIEVISYNEGAGRFEFQVVQDYGPQAEPRVGYADRALCSRCHQNAGPIFSRPLWDETNANADVAARLTAVAGEFHGVPAAVGVDVPDAIDVATDRGSDLLLHQKIWTDGCAAAGSGAVACRAELALEVLRYALSGRRHDRSAGARRHSVSRILGAVWQDAWPAGLAVADPDIANRRLELFAPGAGPLDLPGALGAGRPLSAVEITERSSIPFDLEPFRPRPPREIRHTFAPADVDLLVDGLASFLSSRDVRALDALLDSRGRSEAASVWKTSCRLPADTSSRVDVGRRRIVCGEPAREDSLALHARIELGGPGEGTPGRGRLDHLTLPGSDRFRNRDLSIRRDPGSDGWLLEVPGGLRTVRGDSVRRVALSATGRENGTVQVEVAHDFRLLEDAVARLAERTCPGAVSVFGAAPFQRRVLMGALFRCLGGDYPDAGLDPEEMPPARLATHPADLDPAGTLPPVPEGGGG